MKTSLIAFEATFVDMTSKQGQCVKVNSKQSKSKQI
jgi:hypothetical protein